MKQLIASLIKFQKEVGTIPKNKINPHYKSKYAELSVVIDVCQPALNLSGLAVIQTIKTQNEDNILVTHLLHESGESISSEVFLPRIADPQKLTAALTYLRRASYLSIVGLVAEDDLDGNDAIEGQHRQSQQTAPQNQFKQQSSSTQTTSAPASDAQKNALRKMGIHFQDNITKNEASNLIAQGNR